MTTEIEFKPQEHKDLITYSDLNYEKIVIQIKSNPQYEKLKWDMDNEPYDKFWYYDNNLPSFNKIFCRLISRFRAIPSQEAAFVAYMISYAKELNEIYKEVSAKLGVGTRPNDRYLFDMALKKRIYNNFYPSILRDVAGAAQLKDLLPKFDVLYNPEIDFKAQIDVLLYWGKKNVGFGLQQYRKTDEGESNYEDKQTNRHASIVFTNVNKFAVAVDMDKEVNFVNNVLLIDYEKVLPRIKDKIKELLGK